jgi:hypothetical protein
MASSSTDWRRSSEGWRLDDIPDLALAGMLGVPVDQVPARRAKLAEQQREPAWVEAALEALPAATLSILQLLAEGGGVGTDLQLARAAQARYGLREDLYRHAVLPAMRAVLVVPLSTRDAGSALALVQPAAQIVAPKVIDLDVTPLPLAAFLPGAPAGADPRTFLALCIATRHVDLKLNKGGALHFGAVKRLAKQVGIDERVADSMLRVALEARLLAPDGELVRPDIEALVATATGHYSASTGVTALQALLASGPIEREAALRWCERRALPHVARLICDGLSYLPGFTSGTVDGEAALSYRAPEGSTGGHITPSFEVILPPESRLLDVVQVGACCDWVRLDRALVARITRPAVSRALAAGATGDEVLGWLASASQHPIPQNVEVSIRDWAGAVIPATLATGHVVVIDAAVEGHALAALGKLDPRRVAPGVLVVGSAVPMREVSKALLAAGIQLDAGAPARPRPATTARPIESALAAPRLRGKVTAWLRGEPFEGVRDSYLDNLQAPTSTSGKAALLPAVDPLARLVEWAGVHDIDDRDEIVERLLDGPMADVLTRLSARDLDQLFSRARSLDDLIKGVAKLVTQRGIGRPPAISHAPRVLGPGAASPRARRPRPVLLWQQEQLRPRLEAAAEGAEWIALDVGGSVRFVEIERVTRRGSMWFVLGDDLEDGTAVALALDKITAIAALPDDVDIDELRAQEHAAPGERGGSRPWRPPPGMPAPAGHVACPCGSGQRYRNCCRRAAQA